MAELDQLYDALRKADAAGHTDDAKKLADLVKDTFVVEERELVECKGLGQILTSFLNSRK